MTTGAKVKYEWNCWSLFLAKITGQRTFALNGIPFLDVWCIQVTEFSPSLDRATPLSGNSGIYSLRTHATWERWNLGTECFPLIVSIIYLAVVELRWKLRQIFTNCYIVYDVRNNTIFYVKLFILYTVYWSKQIIFCWRYSLLKRNSQLSGKNA